MELFLKEEKKNRFNVWELLSLFIVLRGDDLKKCKDVKGGGGAQGMFNA